MGADHKGLSLVEVVLAMALFFLTFSFVFGIFPASKRSATLGRRVNAATLIAEERMDTVLSRPYDAVVDEGPDPVILSQTVDGQDLSDRYEVRVKVSELEAGKLKDVLVTVSWRAGTVERKVELENYRAQY